MCFDLQKFVRIKRLSIKTISQACEIKRKIIISGHERRVNNIQHTEISLKIYGDSIKRENLGVHNNKNTTKKEKFASSCQRHEKKFLERK